MDRLENSLGYLVLQSDGAVLKSGGDLENDEKSANIFMGLLSLTDSVDENFMENNSCECISIIYEDHSYNICMSNRLIYILKRRGGSNTSSSDNSKQGHGYLHDF